MKKLIIVICLVIVLGVVGFIMWNDRVVSTITMDINPSIKLELNKKNIIKNAIALNEDANKIVDNLKDRTLDDALYTLVGNLINEKIVDESGISLIIYSTGNINNEDVTPILTNYFVEKDIAFTIIPIEKVTKEDEEVAAKYNITVSKASYINQLADIDNSNLADRSIKEIEDIKRVGLYCDSGYTLDGDKCIKEIRRESLSYGKKCPSGYVTYNDKCYKEGGFTEGEKEVCYGEFVLKDGKCVFTDTFKAEGVCENGDYVSGKDKCHELIYVADAYEFCRDSGRTLYEHKCLATKPTINGGCLGKDMLYNKKCVNTRNDYYPAEWKCPNGKVISNADGSLLYEDHKCYEDKYTEVSSYKCPEGYTVTDKMCTRTETHLPEKERTCEKGYTLNKDGMCIDTKDKVDFIYGDVCEHRDSKQIDNECVIYEVVDAKSY